MTGTGDAPVVSQSSYGMSESPFTVAGVRNRHSVAHIFTNPRRRLSAADPTIGTGERKRPQIDGSARKGFIRNLFDVVANGDAAAMEHHGVGG
jgi:hypothetical protein